MAGAGIFTAQYYGEGNDEGIRQTVRFKIWIGIAITAIAWAVFMPQMAFIHATYFTLRSGGKTIVTFLFDSVYMRGISIPVAFILSRFTDIPAVYIFALVQVADWVKCIIGYVLVKKGVWMQNIVSE